MRRPNLRNTASAVSTLALAATMGMHLAAARGWAQDTPGDVDRIRIGFQVAPVPLNLAGKTPPQILQVGGQLSGQRRQRL